MFDVSSYRGYLRRAYGIMPEANKFAKTDEADHHDIKNWRLVRQAAASATASPALTASNPSSSLSRKKQQQQPKPNKLNRRFFDLGNLSNSFGIGGGLLGGAVAASALAYSQKQQQQPQPNNLHRRFFNLGDFSDSFGGGGFFGGGNYGENGEKGDKFGGKQKEKCQFISYHHQPYNEGSGGLFSIGLGG